MIGNNKIKTISTTFVVVSRFDFITSVNANMSSMIAATPKSVPIVVVFSLFWPVELSYEEVVVKVRIYAR